MSAENTSSGIFSIGAGIAKQFLGLNRVHTSSRFRISDQWKAGDFSSLILICTNELNVYVS
jgi:hypothetical protein